MPRRPHTRTHMNKQQVMYIFDVPFCPEAATARELAAAALGWRVPSLSQTQALGVYFEFVPHTTPVTVNTHVWTRAIDENSPWTRKLLVRQCFLPRWNPSIQWYTFQACFKGQKVSSLVLIWIWVNERKIKNVFFFIKIDLFGWCVIVCFLKTLNTWTLS